MGERDAESQNLVSFLEALNIKSSSLLKQSDCFKFLSWAFLCYSKPQWRPMTQHSWTISLFRVSSGYKNFLVLWRKIRTMHPNSWFRKHKYLFSYMVSISCNRLILSFVVSFFCNDHVPSPCVLMRKGGESSRENKEKKYENPCEESEGQRGNRKFWLHMFEIKIDYYPS